MEWRELAKKSLRKKKMKRNKKICLKKKPSIKLRTLKQQRKKLLKNPMVKSYLKFKLVK